ncbi:helicase-like protein [Kribbella sp. VKM Ac-2527]|uniref:Helicase-like protein n=2 Tax=Kribbella caucasensis TaxID=2512215 RepID=A0A4R6IXM4_9ACTN|nr:helicase-like protein [Kribbella sp. VKM Ac-2527]
MVFCDLGTPREDWNVYDELKNLLVARGVPAEQIAFIHSAKNDRDKAALFEAAKTGQVQVLLGSTTKMGVGTNAQDRVVALHHVDCPWRPADIVQRDGRGRRQGNQNAEIEILRYVTEGTFDTYSWQTVERKARFIGQFMSARALASRMTEVLSAPRWDAADHPVGRLGGYELTAKRQYRDDQPYVLVDVVGVPVDGSRSPSAAPRTPLPDWSSASRTPSAASTASSRPDTSGSTSSPPRSAAPKANSGNRSSTKRPSTRRTPPARRSTTSWPRLQLPRRPLRRPSRTRTSQRLSES